MAVPQSRDELSAQVRRAAEEALSESDLLLFVVDAKDGLSPIDQELARVLRKSQKALVLVINKIDNEKREPLAAEFDSLGFEPSFSISAEHDRGISELLGEIERRLPAPANIEHRTSNTEHLTQKLLRSANNFFQLLDLVALLTNKQFRVTDDVDEQDVPDFEFHV